MTIPQKQLVISLDEKLTWGEMSIFSSDSEMSNIDRLVKLRAFLAKRSNWTLAEMDKIADGDETLSVMEMVGNAIREAAVPKVKNSPSRIGPASKARKAYHSGSTKSPTEKPST